MKIEVYTGDLMQASIDKLLEILSDQVKKFHACKKDEHRNLHRRMARAAYIAIHAIDELGWAEDTGDADKKWQRRFTATVGKEWIKKLWPWEEK